MFGGIRSGCGCNENPTVCQFIGSLKTQIINGLTKHTVGNCEADDMSLLMNLKSFLGNPDEQVAESMEPSASSTTHEPLRAPEADQILPQVRKGDFSILSVAYVAGYIVKRDFPNLECEVCRSLLTSDPQMPCNTFIVAKEFDDENRLIYPSENLVVKFYSKSNNSV